MENVAAKALGVRSLSEVGDLTYGKHGRHDRYSPHRWGRMMEVSRYHGVFFSRFDWMVMTG